MQTPKCLGSSQYTTCFNLCGSFSREGLPPQLSTGRAAITSNHISLVFDFVVNYDGYVYTMSFYEASLSRLLPVHISVVHAHHHRRFFAKLGDRFASAKASSLFTTVFIRMRKKMLNQKTFIFSTFLDMLRL